MQIQEIINYTKLFDVYGKLLSQKQFEVMDKFLNLDIGESEIAEMENTSRQSVHDAITKAKKQLLEFEKKCHFVEQDELLREDLLKLKQDLIKTNQSTDLIDKIITKL